MHARENQVIQLRAWKILQSIRVGETRSYSWMAKRLGDENARRAVGRANGTNMICIIIPVPPHYSRRRYSLRVRRWFMAQEVAARSRAKVRASRNAGE
jgi:O-6-methylguanine DNA methyltransferase